jgi:hypothetical protein
VSVQDFIRPAARPRLAAESLERRGLDMLTPEDINTEIAAHRREKKSSAAPAAN